MAKLDWETTYAALSAAVQTTDAAEAAIGQDLLTTLDEIGTSYNDAYTPLVEASKNISLSAYSSSLATWEIATEDVHNQTMKVIWYAEDELTITRSSLPNWSTSAEALTANKSAMTSKLDTTKATASKAGDTGLRDLLSSFRAKFLTAYNSQPELSYGGSYGETRSVTVPGVGLVTVAKAEELLQAAMDEANELGADIAFVP